MLIERIGDRRLDPPCEGCRQYGRCACADEEVTQPWTPLPRLPMEQALAEWLGEAATQVEHRWDSVGDAKCLDCGLQRVHRKFPNLGSVDGGFSVRGYDYGRAGVDAWTTREPSCLGGVA